MRKRPRFLGFFIHVPEHVEARRFVVREHERQQTVHRSFLVFMLENLLADRHEALADYFPPHPAVPRKNPHDTLQPLRCEDFHISLAGGVPVIPTLHPVDAVVPRPAGVMDPHIHAVSVAP